MNDIISAQSLVRKEQPNFIVGVGGGRSVDVAKMISFNLNIPFISVPTSASHGLVHCRGNNNGYF